MVDVKKLESEILSQLDCVGEPEQLQTLRNTFTGRKGKLTLALRSLGTMDKEERSGLGKELNNLRSLVEDRIVALEKKFREDDRQELIGKDQVDVTLPGKHIVGGGSHPLTQVMREIINIFISFGFVLAEGTDLETDYYNFGALNFPEDHPARDAQDTFYTDITNEKDGTFILRTHTSPVQIHVMQSVRPPIRTLMPGRVYRHEAIDSSHSAVFHQVEGLAVDTHITFADLKGILTLFVRRMFGPTIKVRFRPSFFPFTEPSAEIDIQCLLCKGKGCGVCKRTGWLEMLGAGMVHPNVFRAVKYDPHVVSGYAFGMGVERIAMLKFGVNDMRLFFENDMRFLRQF